MVALLSESDPCWRDGPQFGAVHTTNDEDNGDDVDNVEDVDDDDVDDDDDEDEDVEEWGGTRKMTRMWCL